MAEPGGKVMKIEPRDNRLLPYYRPEVHRRHPEARVMTVHIGLRKLPIELRLLDSGYWKAAELLHDGTGRQLAKHFRNYKFRVTQADRAAERMRLAVYDIPPDLWAQIMRTC